MPPGDLLDELVEDWHGQLSEAIIKITPGIFLTLAAKLLLGIHKRSGG